MYVEQYVEVSGLVIEITL